MFANKYTNRDVHLPHHLSMLYAYKRLQNNIGEEEKKKKTQNFPCDGWRGNSPPSNTCSKALPACYRPAILEWTSAIISKALKHHWFSKQTHVHGFTNGWRCSPHSCNWIVVNLNIQPLETLKSLPASTSVWSIHISEDLEKIRKAVTSIELTIQHQY